MPIDPLHRMLFIAYAIILTGTWVTGMVLTWRHGGLLTHVIGSAGFTTGYLLLLWDVRRVAVREGIEPEPLSEPERI